MWSLERLRLILPAGFEHRAERIARQVAEELAALPVARDVRLDHLSLPPIAVASGADDGAIAAQIARALSAAVFPGGRAC